MYLPKKAIEYFLYIRYHSLKDQRPKIILIYQISWSKIFWCQFWCGIDLWKRSEVFIINWWQALLLGRYMCILYLIQRCKRNVLMIHITFYFVNAPFECRLAAFIWLTYKHERYKVKMKCSCKYKISII